MKKMIVALVLSCILISCSEREEDKSKMQIRDKTAYVVGDKKPFTGKFVEKYPNGQIKREISVKDGKYTGNSKDYYENGQLSSEFKVNKNGKTEWKMYDENGIITKDQIF